MLAFWKLRVVAATAELDPPLPPTKTFVPKNALPQLSDYKTHADTAFWSSFPSNMIEKGNQQSLKRASGHGERGRLKAVCRDWKNGADSRCRGTAKEPTFTTNAPSAHNFGTEVTDAVATWVKQGIVAGPLDPSKRPANEVSGVMCRMKPNGAARDYYEF